MNVYEVIAKRCESMSKSQKKIAQYILNHKAEVCFLNVSHLAQASQVSEATIVRFALFLGYKGYPQMQKDLQAQTQKQLSMRERINISGDAFQEEAGSLHEIFADEIERLRQTEHTLDAETFFQVVEVIQKAKHIYVVAGLSAVSLAYFLQYYLNIMRGDTYLIGHDTSFSEDFCSITNEDLVIGITFPRYTKQTCELVHYAYKKGVPTVCLTDTMASPVIKDSTYYLLCESTMPTYIDSFVAPLTVINAILTYIGKNSGTAQDERLANLENLWDAFDVFL